MDKRLATKDEFDYICQLSGIDPDEVQEIWLYPDIPGNCDVLMKSNVDRIDVNVTVST